MEFVEFELLINILFLDAIIKSYSPQICHKLKYTKGYFAGYEIGVNISTCKLLFVYEEPGGGGVMVGSSSSNFEDSKDGWYDLDRITAYVSKRPFMWGDPHKGMPYDKKIVAAFSYTAKTFSPLLVDIMKMFRNKDSVKEWRIDYQKYEEQQVRLKYPGLNS